MTSKTYTELTDRLDRLELDKDCVLTRELLGQFEQIQQCDSLIFTQRQRFIGFCAPPKIKLPFESQQHLHAVDWYGYKSTYRDLGLMLFSLLLSDEHYIEVKLSQSVSSIKTLYLYHERPQIESAFLSVERPASYKSYQYYRQIVDKFPFSGLSFTHRSLVQDALPHLSYGWTKQDYNADFSTQVAQADQLIVSLSTAGLCALGCLWLDLSALTQEQNEVCLESPSLGFGGVAENSLETRLWLPGSFGFYTDRLEDLTF